ncbi:MAG: hypothetical protein LBK99_20645 [Opitutaceae bacterium]|nr:hypothetical protein [Opitutaceae bacterium]
MPLFRGENFRSDADSFAGPSYAERYKLFLKQSLGAHSSSRMNPSLALR